ncbi:glycosyltransferase [Desulfoluna spongiiphila]|uniref:Glycosyl transferase family 2 n=1 Tax=Desulfoluna spongiiphila TaxID=419481 RepID=A0A1G5JNL9_9BACT|nr:glycosyltransferase [Desulfoluna spongiiphila]SCY89936.1 Glycosyl transferase family 2 [Desulfoluna spongiiphila]
MKLSPIALFVYNRPWHTQQTIEALQKNELSEQSDLFVVSDGPKNQQDQKNVMHIRKYLQTISNFKSITIIERENNWGLADSIIDGVTHIINRHGKIIVLEDDLITSPFFLTYMNNALNFYQGNKNIFSISGYNLPPDIMPIPKSCTEEVYLNYRSSSWGWGTWENRWEKADWSVKDYNQFLHNKKEQKLFNRGGNDLTHMLSMHMNGTIDSWSIRWSYTHHKYNSLCIYPLISYIDNIGFDGSGIHCGHTTKFSNNICIAPKSILLTHNLKINKQLIKRFTNVYSPGLISQLKQLIKKIMTNG